MERPWARGMGAMPKYPSLRRLLGVLLLVVDHLVPRAMRHGP